MQLTNIIPLILATLVVASPVNHENMSLLDRSLVDRESCRVTSQRNTQTVGNGNPHQNFIFKQVSGTTDCSNNPSGSASVSQSYSVDWSVTAGFAGEFITGGFAVGETATTGYTNTFGCKTSSGSHTGDLCIFERIQITAFTAQTQECTTNSCTGTSCTPWSTGVIYAPNSGQGSCYYDNYQALLPCTGPGKEHLITKGPAGGPQYLPCEPIL